jgi:hypothetical protein
LNRPREDRDRYATSAAPDGDPAAPADRRNEQMSWTIERRSRVAVVTMTTNPVTPGDCLEQYAFTKRAAQAAALRDIAQLADPLDRQLPEQMTSDQARHAHRRYWQRLKGIPAPC